jgi:hypothetical protein
VPSLLKLCLQFPPRAQSQSLDRPLAGGRNPELLGLTLALGCCCRKLTPFLISIVWLLHIILTSNALLGLCNRFYLGSMIIDSLAKSANIKLEVIKNPEDSIPWGIVRLGLSSILLALANE